MGMHDTAAVDGEPFTTIPGLLSMMMRWPRLIDQNPSVVIAIDA